MKACKLIPIIAASAVLGLVSPASAGVITFAGATTDTLKPAATNTNFTGASINITTDASGNSAPFTIGSIDILNANYGALNDALTLNVTFTNPLNGSNPLVIGFTADIYTYHYFNGFSWTNYHDIWFDSIAPQLVTYTNSGGTGSFNIGLTGPVIWESEMSPDIGNHTYYSSGSTIQARITNATFTPTAPVPEPMTLLILDAGLVGLGAVCRKRHA